MTNHPNRNWRQRMQQAADQWQTTSKGKALAEIPMTPGPQFIPGMRNRLREAYLSGYDDGRKPSASSINNTTGE